MNLNTISIIKEVEIPKGKSNKVDTSLLKKEGTLYQSCFNCQDGTVFVIYEGNILVCSECSHENHL
jgi:hypothetical protein